MTHKNGKKLNKSRCYIKQPIQQFSNIQAEKNSKESHETIYNESIMNKNNQESGKVDSLIVSTKNIYQKSVKNRANTTELRNSLSNEELASSYAKSYSLSQLSRSSSEISEDQNVTFRIGGI
jgi:hypothetical protein